jgi:hypothetical protein
VNLRGDEGHFDPDMHPYLHGERVLSVAEQCTLADIRPNSEVYAVYSIAKNGDRFGPQWTEVKKVDIGALICGAVAREDICFVVNHPAQVRLSLNPMNTMFFAW